jgi:hypothetical protein
LAQENFITIPFIFKVTGKNFFFTFEIYGHFESTNQNKMDIIVKEAAGLPDKAYVSIRIGETRRQGPHKPEESFHFPASQHATMKVDIFNFLGNTAIPLYKLKNDASHVEEIEIEGMKLKLACVIVDGDGDKKRPAKHESALKATKYLDDHGVQGTLQGLIHSLLARQPDDPLAYMIEYLTNKQNGNDSAPAMVKKTSDEVKSAPVVNEKKEEAETPAPAAEADVIAENVEPTSATEKPASEAEAPVPETEAPVMETEVPAAEAEVSVVEAEAPVAEAEVPSAEAEAPAEKADDIPPTNV